MTDDSPRYQLPALHTGNRTLDLAFRAAVGDVLGNVARWGSGEDASGDDRRRCLLAGLHYDRPWTRDAAINAWNGVSLFWPDLARNTLEAVLVRDDALRIGGQYWDAIIWTAGAWHHYLATGDRDFLAIAYEATVNTLARAESRELDPEDGLFRGGACFMDGISGYPDWYVNPDFDSGIAGWSARHPADRHPAGEGFPGKALSTNLLYREAYRTLRRIARELDLRVDPHWETMAARLGESIRRRFTTGTGALAYLVDPWGGSDRQEGLGWSFAVLFDLLEPDRRDRLVSLARSSGNGITALWPDFERYRRLGPGKAGRHGATVWPHVNAFWADALVRAGRREEAWRELELLAGKAVRDGHFAEIYHHETGLRYGGEQEDAGCGGHRSWVSEPRQSWCATGYFRMIASVLFGLRLDPAGPSWDPWLPPGMNEATLTGLTRHAERVDATLRRVGDRVVVECS